MKLLIATHNPGKEKDYKECLKDAPFEVVSLKDIGIGEEAPENENTFTENAIKKVEFYSDLTGYPAIGDDGGLVIDALDGAPGVKSRRWLGYEMSDDEIIRTVLERMEGVPFQDRTCRLTCVVAYIDLSGEVFTEQCEVKGFIAEKPSVKKVEGYPYRSLFYFKNMGLYYSELTEKQLKEISHRRKTLLAIKEKIK